MLTIPRYPACSHHAVAALLGSPQWPGHTRGTGVPPSPGRQWQCRLGGGIRNPGGWSTGAWVAALAGLKPKCPSWGTDCSHGSAQPLHPPSFSPGAMRSSPAHKAPPLQPGPTHNKPCPYHPEPHPQTPPLLPSPAPISRSRPPPRQCYLTASQRSPVTPALQRQLAHCEGHRGLCPAWGAVTSRRKSPWEITLASS